MCQIKALSTKKNRWRPCIKKTDDPSDAVLCQHLNSDGDTEHLYSGGDSDNDKMDCIF